MKIAVDAMGGDNAPDTIVQGVERARDAFEDMTFILYGDETKIKAVLKDSTRISIVHTTEKINGEDEPVRAVRRKKDASMVVAAQAVKEKDADALFSAGNTGALLAAGIFIVGRIPGIDRPGLMPTLPMASSEKGWNLLDAGANAESKPEYLYQYALMGSYYAKQVRGIKNPTVALLNNGTEPTKGDDLHKEAYKLISENKDINFIGNVEARDLLEGVADVVVTDGFTGNAALKAIEGTAKTVMSLVKHTIMDSGLKGKIGGALLHSNLSEIKNKFDYSRHGGAVLFGLKAPIVKGHGAADETAVYYALAQIRDMVSSQLIQSVIDYFGESKTENGLKSTSDETEG